MTGKITTMPGLPATPMSDFINLDDHGNIHGLY
jgi:formyltetrahydrofolate synthetase